MPKIKYIFSDGTTSEIEVTDELYVVHLELLQEEKRNHWRETRRHISLYYLMELGVDFIDTAADSFAAVELSENDERIHNAIKKLSCKQRELLKKVFYEGKTLTAIAQEQNISQSAITQQLATIYKKIKKFLEKTL
ncbi:MAG: sigma-70 family RNA polymerase sigma factor [Roseburia sp.]|nr:sigma-70 family RNA polymerase sigma factor [Roseburia sp.]